MKIIVELNSNVLEQILFLIDFTEYEASSQKIVTSSRIPISS